jgi:outer membrane protein assembly factor BamD
MNRRSFFPSLRASTIAGLAVASLLVFSIGAVAQATDASQAAAAPDNQAQQSVTMASPTAKGSKKEDKVVQSKDTKKQMRKEKKIDPQAVADAKLPDRQLYDKALAATKKGHFDVARLDLQTLLNTYPDSQYQMKAKLAIADSWYREGGTAALTQAESEYKDFISFFPNAPEAAEAQMRVGDIYFRQMDKPDRDYVKAVHAQEEYRLMLQQFPESALVPQAKQRLREVQEVLATREADIAEYYSTRENWPATIARYQTVVDTYPQFSHMDDVLVGLGDAYGAEARYVRSLKLPEAGKARLEKVYDDQAASAYTKVVLEHSASPHVEDARDRLAAMNLPIPTPTPEQAAASVALENSRHSYRLQDRAKLMILHQPDVVMAARDGEPSLTDPKPTMAPDVYKKVVADFNSAMNPNAAAAAAAKVASPAENAAAPTEGAAPATAPAAAPLQLQEVPAADSGSNTGAAVMTNVPAATSSTTRGATNSMGVEIITPSAATSPGAGTPAAVTPAATTAAPDNGGLKAVGPPDPKALPPIEKAAGAPDQVNDIKPGTQPAAQAPRADGKKTKPEFDKGDESSSKHKKKKGLAKINPF